MKKILKGYKNDQHGAHSHAIGDANTGGGHMQQPNPNPDPNLTLTLALTLTLNPDPFSQNLRTVPWAERSRGGALSEASLLISCRAKTPMFVIVLFIETLFHIKETPGL